MAAVVAKTGRKLGSTVVSDVHLAKIAKEVVLWEDLAPYLSLSEAEIVEIQKDNAGSYRQQKVGCLKMWKQSHGDRATYRCLMDATRISDQSRASSYINGILSEENSPRPFKAHDNPGDKSIPSLPSSVREDLMQRLEQNLVNIRNQYASYARHIRIAVEEKGINVSDLRAYVLSLPAFIDKYDGDTKQVKLFSGRKVDFEKANSIIEIFNLLILDCCSFLDCNTFQQIIKEFKIDCNSDEVVNYPKLLKEYVCMHKISEFVQINPLLEKSISKELLILKFDTVSLTCKLSDVLELKKAVANILGLRSSALEILSIEEGCIILTFLISDVLAEALFNTTNAMSPMQVEQFQDLDAVWLHCGGKYMFNFKEEKEEHNLYSGEEVIVQTIPSRKSSQPDPEFEEAVKTIEEIQSTIEELLLTREKTLESLQALKGSIEKSYDKSRKAKIGGSATAIGGSILGIIGFGLAPVTFGTSLALGITGGVIAAAGGVAIAGAEIGYTVKSKRKKKAFNEDCGKDTELMIHLKNCGDKLDHLMEVLSERYRISPDSIFQLLHHNTPSRVVHGIINSGRMAKTTASTARAVLAGTRTVWATLRPAIRVFGVVSVAIDVVFIPVDVTVLVKSAYDVHKYKKGKSNSSAAKDVGKLITELEEHRDKLRDARDVLAARGFDTTQTKDEFSDYVRDFVNGTLQPISNP